MSLVISLAYRNSGALRICLRKDVLASHVGNVASVPRDVLHAHLMLGTPNPVVCESTLVPVNVQVWLVLSERVSPQWSAGIKPY